MIRPKWLESKPQWTFPGQTDEPDVDVILGTGEIVTMPAFMARTRELVLEQRQADRIAYCDAHDIDEASWPGCHGCEGTGYHKDNHLPCWCGYGAIRQRDLLREEIRSFNNQVTLLREEAKHGSPANHQA